MTVRDDLLARVDIVDVVGRFVSLKRTGKNWLGLCPFHKEKTPSFTVAEDKQIYKCFGCGKGGNAVNFLMEIERIDFRDAMKELARTVNFDLTPYEKHPEITEKRQQEREKLKLLNKRVQEFFVKHFIGSLAESYIVEKRKLSSETIEDFGIGYAPESYLELIDRLKSKGFTSDDMMQAGIVTQGTGGVIPFFRQRVTFPIRDHIGNIVGFGARALLSEQNPKYLNTTETPLYEKSQILFGLDKARQHLKEYGFLIVVEGYMDVIALHQYGLPVGIATCGTALTTDHIKLLKRHTDQVILLFDNDQAGFEATTRALKVAYQADLFPRAFGLPIEYKDVDEWLTAGGDKSMIQKEALDAFQFVLQRRGGHLDLANPVLRKKFQQEMFEIVQYLEDYGILLLYLEYIGTKLRLGLPEIQREFKIRLKQQKRGIRAEKSSGINRSLPDPMKLLGALLWKDFWKQLKHHEDLEIQMHTIRELAVMDDHYFLSTIVNHQMGDELCNELLTLQLRREQQLHSLATDKMHGALEEFVKKQTHILIKTLLKNPSLNPEKKAGLLQMLRQA